MTDLVPAALLAGLTGGVHCIGMCGPFASAGGTTWHLGRLSSYLVFGALVGLGGRALPSTGWALVAAALLLTWSSLRFGGFLHGGEAAGSWLTTLARHTRTLPPWAASYALGLLTALLPCGLFWSALGLATASGGAAEGALVLGAFALGTLPALFAAGALLHRLATRARKVVALVVLVAGLCAIAQRAGALPPSAWAIVASSATIEAAP